MTHRQARRSAAPHIAAPASHSSTHPLLSSFPFGLLRLSAMSVRKRARITKPEQSHTPRDETSATQPTPSTPSAQWSTLPPESLQHISTFLLRSPRLSSFVRTNIVQLLRISFVCANWRNMVYSSAGHINFWSAIGPLSVVESKRHEQQFYIANRWRLLPLVPTILPTLRHVRVLVIRFGSPPVANVIAVLQSLPLFTRLVTLDSILPWACVPHDRQAREEARDALRRAFAAVASYPTTQLTSLSLHFPERVRPADVTTLRRLCSSALELSLSTDELQLMAWGSKPLYDRVWKAHRVQSLFLPPQTWREYLSDDDQLNVTTLAKALPSCTHLHLHAQQDPSDVHRLLRQFGRRLLFLHSPAATISQLPSADVQYTALTSLSLSDDGTHDWSGEGISDTLASLSSYCPQLNELTVVSRMLAPWRDVAVSLAPIPQLRYLHCHIESARIVVQGTLPQPFQTMLTPNLTHLSLTLDQSQAVPVLLFLNAQQRLPQLTRFHIRCSQSQPDWKQMWVEEKERLKSRLGAVWCEKEEEVVRWRADRVWRRSVGLADPARTIL